MARGHLSEVGRYSCPMMRCGRSISLCLIFLWSSGLLAQEGLGVAFSNYLPSRAVQLNPALIADSRTYMDVHAIGLSFFGLNDHTYFASEGPGLWSAMAGRGTSAVQSEAPGSRSGYIDFSFDGSGLFKVDGRQSFGLSTRYRAMFNGRGVPEELAQLFYHGFRYSPLYDQPLDLNGMTASAMAWGELNASYAYMLEVTDEHHLNAGITLKRLFGTDHYGLKLGEADYTFTSQDLRLTGLKGEYAYVKDNLGIGNGWAIDLGLMFRKTIDGRSTYVPFSKKSQCSQSDYKYEWGFSVLDLGAVRFNDNAAYVKVIEADVLWPDYIDSQLSDLEQLDVLLMERVETDQNITRRSSDYKVSLPSALSLQFDYNFSKGFHTSAMIQERIKRGGSFDLWRARVAAVIPRFESEDLEVALPLSTFEYEKLRVGLSVRYRSFTLGSDDLIDLALDRDLYGADIYFSFNILLLEGSECASSTKKSPKRLIAPCWGD